jgi:hypothetical protein
MQSDVGWKAAAKTNWLEIGVPEFLAGIGVDFDKYFIEAVNRSSLNVDPYDHATWEIWPHSQIPSGVLHCYPKEVKANGVNWEEWFLMDGEIHHHILSNTKFDGATGIWVPQPGDADHPVAILDFSWHYEISEDLRPLKYINNFI